MSLKISKHISRDRLWLRPLAWTLLIPLLLPLSAAGDPIQIENFSTHSRLIIRLDESVPTEWKNVPGGFEVFFNGIGLADLGAPLGEENSWQARFQALKDEPRIESLNFAEVAGGVRVQGKWKFPTGKDALSDPKMEVFDYRDKNPPQYVVDFWPRKGATRVAVKNAREAVLRSAALKQQEEQAHERASRKLASEKVKAEAYDIGRFCREPLQEMKDVFLKVFPVHEPVDYSRWISATTPDNEYQYFEPQTKEKDAQYVRLALELYRQGKPALVVRTLEFFETEHPNSPFRQEMKFLKANALVKLAHPKQAEDILRDLMGAGKEVPVALHSAMFLAGRLATQKSHLEAFETFSWLLTQHPEHRLNWLFHLGAAESLAGLKQTDRAAKEYQWIIEHGPDRKVQAEAAARLGDIYLGRFDYARSLASYSQALQYFPGEMKSFPSVQVNRGEALFGLGVAEREEELAGDTGAAGGQETYFNRASETFQAFLKDYPAHPSGWRAAFRLGEIEGHRLDRTAESRKWFYETINRFPFSTGATLARMRLIPCGDHGGFGLEASQRFFETEGAGFDGHGEMPMIHYREFRDLAQVRSLLAWNREDEAVKLLTQEINSDPSSKMRPALQQMFAVLFRKRIIGMIAEGKKYEALAFYNKKVTLLPKEGRSFDPDYLLKLSQAASDLGLAKLGQQLAREYEKLTDPADSAKEGESSRSVAATAPSGSKAPAAVLPPDLSDQLKLAEKSYTAAKALWIASGLSEEPRVRALLSKVIEESPFFMDREIILGLLEEKHDQLSAALGHATRAQLQSAAETDASRKPGLRLDAWLARLEARAGEPKVALGIYKTLEARLSANTPPPAPAGKSGRTGRRIEDPAEILGVPAVPALEEIMLCEAELLEKQGRWGEAAVQYSAAVDHGLGGEQAKFGYAHALLKSGGKGNREKAQGILQSLVRDLVASNSIESEKWRRLAQETLAHLNDRKFLGSRRLTGNAKEGMK